MSTQNASIFHEKNDGGVRKYSGYSGTAGSAIATSFHPLNLNIFYKMLLLHIIVLNLVDDKNWPFNSFRIISI